MDLLIDIFWVTLIATATLAVLSLWWLCVKVTFRNLAQILNDALREIDTNNNTETEERND